MLLHLHVKNYALIDEINVDFNDNLNILTGETGAGKSIIIGSINAVLGGKVSKDMIRTGCESAIIELLFYVDNNVVLSKLHEYDISMDNNKELLITRKININGRSVFRMNGQVVTTSIVKDISTKLIDIHGQHEHQSLLNKKNYLSLLDTFCGVDVLELKDKLREKYTYYMELSSKIDHFMLDEHTRKKEISFLEYEINEIISANLIIGEDKKLKEEYTLLSNGKKIIKSMSEIHTYVNGDSTNITGAIDHIGQAVKLLSGIKTLDKNIMNMEEQISNIEIMLSDFNRDINDYISSFELDESRYFEIEDRIDLINNLKMKYGDTIEEVLNYKEEKEKYLEELINHEEHLNQINEEINNLKNEIEVYCGDLTRIRKEKAVHISKLIINALRHINLLNTNFVIEVNRANKFNANGWDDIEFLISTNVGEPLKSLSKVASGGELSRIMLAIKSVLAGSDDIESLIFDEIDTGISGKTAGLVAEKLVQISKEHQVICITHLAQIAAMGDAHFIIQKKVKDNITHTLINKLNKKSSINELARLLGGIKITDAVIANAKEMKDYAEEVKKNS
ncbi:DNA repair protein RecN [Vallitalea sp.]|jgi:DNA repair protein RecN (Recombination protein N)|uniref:DNA repair protein RecN n=1 Tax=Vallitalea sp. TaxID=1882829 RepID=UPI0025FF68A8|nr:DNA repair protein RecN [Vallitalea sp.]MCT4687555.1 DNA repair protein RecN [Vallitalea sp.]